MRGTWTRRRSTRESNNTSGDNRSFVFMFVNYFDYFVSYHALPEAVILMLLLANAIQDVICILLKNSFVRS